MSKASKKNVQKKLRLLFYGFKPWSVTWREETRMKVFEKKALKKVLGPRKGDITGE
jgi:hypothetical protein